MDRSDKRIAACLLVVTVAAAGIYGSQPGKPDEPMTVYDPVLHNDRPYPARDAYVPEDWKGCRFCDPRPDLDDLEMLDVDPDDER